MRERIEFFFVLCGASVLIAFMSGWIHDLYSFKYAVALQSSFVVACSVVAFALCILGSRFVVFKTFLIGLIVLMVVSLYLFAIIFSFGSMVEALVVGVLVGFVVFLLGFVFSCFYGEVAVYDEGVLEDMKVLRWFEGFGVLGTGAKLVAAVSPGESSRRSRHWSGLSLFAGGLGVVAINLEKGIAELLVLFFGVTSLAIMGYSWRRMTKPILFAAQLEKREAVPIYVEGFEPRAARVVVKASGERRAARR